MGGSPSVSIVLATHNRAGWLRLAMDSVLEQDHSDLELLVVDDGSTDETPGLLEDYARRHPSERFRFSRHSNMGQARTLNRGYELARGEVLGYLSDDDLLLPGAVSELVRRLVDRETVAVYPGYRIIDAEGGVIDTFRPLPYTPAAAFRLMDTIIGPGGLVRRHVLESTGGWDPELRFMGDFILWMKVGLAGKVARVPEPLACWRRHGEGLSLQVGAEHGRELLRLVDLGAGLLGLPAGDVETRAEALRNACVQAAFFGGGGGASPGERFATIDLQRAETSALSNALEPEEQLDQRADEAAGLWRELARLTGELAQTRARRAGSMPARGGLKAALARLRRAGALTAPGEQDGDAWGRRDLRTELLEAAIDCGTDTTPGSNRFLIVDRRDQTVTEEELAELNSLGYRSTPGQLRAAVDDRRRKLETAVSAQGRPSLATRLRRALSS